MLPYLQNTYFVALFTRAWIEISSIRNIRLQAQVALFTRAWIEISFFGAKNRLLSVALFTRAWIEISENEPFAL